VLPDSPASPADEENARHRLDARPVIHEESIKARVEPPDSSRPSVDFGALGRYIPLDYKENHGHSY